MKNNLILNKKQDEFHAGDKFRNIPRHPPQMGEEKSQGLI